MILGNVLTKIQYGHQLRAPDQNKMKEVLSSETNNQQIKMELITQNKKRIEYEKIVITINHKIKQKIKHQTLTNNIFEYKSIPALELSKVDIGIIPKTEK